MACNTCGTKFNFFHKELGCANCGMSFCSKCLKLKCKLPAKGNTEQNVCRICFMKFAAGSSNSENASIPPPDAYIKTSPSNKSTTLNPIIAPVILLRRLENLENPSAPPITMYQKNSLQNLRSGLSPADLQILERLERLREDKNKVPPPTENEIRIRLASLKGENPYVEGPTKLVAAPDTRTDQQKADDLLEQFMNERDIELAHNPQEGIEARIASLRGQGIRPNENAYISNLHDSSSSEEEMDKITRKIMDEVALDEKCPKGALPDNSEDMETSDSPELPWCVLCNKDGVVRCQDCGGDIYCAECSTEVHREFNEENHKIIPFRPK